jgi:hypothetical protein
MEFGGFCQIFTIRFWCQELGCCHGMWGSRHGGAAPPNPAFALLLVLVLAKLEIIPNAAPCPALDLPLLLVSLFAYS